MILLILVTFLCLFFALSNSHIHPTDDEGADYDEEGGHDGSYTTRADTSDFTKRGSEEDGVYDCGCTLLREY